MPWSLAMPQFSHLHTTGLVLGCQAGAFLQVPRCGSSGSGMLALILPGASLGTW